MGLEYYINPDSQRTDSDGATCTYSEPVMGWTYTSGEYYTSQSYSNSFSLYQGQGIPTYLEIIDPNTGNNASLTYPWLYYGFNSSSGNYDFDFDLRQRPLSYSTTPDEVVLVLKVSFPDPFLYFILV